MDGLNQMFIQRHLYKKKLDKIFDENQKLLQKLMLTLMPLQFYVDGGDAEDFFRYGYSRNPYLTNVNNKFFQMFATPVTAPIHEIERDELIRSKVPFPKLKKVDGEGEEEIKSLVGLAVAQKNWFGSFNQMGPDVTIEQGCKMVDIAAENVKTINTFLLEVDRVVETPYKHAYIKIEQEVTELNKLLGKAEQKLADVRLHAMRASHGYDPKDEKQWEDGDIGLADFEEQQREEKKRYKRMTAAFLGYDEHGNDLPEFLEKLAALPREDLPKEVEKYLALHGK